MILTYRSRPPVTPRMIRGCHLLAALLKRDRTPAMVMVYQDVSLTTRRCLFAIVLIKRCVERKEFERVDDMYTD